MKSTITKRSIVIDGHKTSVSLEDAFWSGLKEIAQDQHKTMSNMVGKIEASRIHGNLSSAIRLFVLDDIGLRPRDLLETMPNPPCGTEKTHTVKDQSL